MYQKLYGHVMISVNLGKISHCLSKFSKDALFHMYTVISMLAILKSEFLCLQMANLEAEASGIHESVYQLPNHNYSSLRSGKYSGTHPAA